MAGATPAARTRRAHLEADLQAAIVQLLRLTLGRRYLVVHIANQELRGARAGIRVGQGVVPGAADLLISGANFSGWLEVKTDAGTLSPSQQRFAEDCAERRIPHTVVRSVDEACAAVVTWGLAEWTRDGALRALPRSRVGGLAGETAAPGGQDAGDGEAVRGVPGGGEPAADVKPRPPLAPPDVAVATPEGVE